MKSVYLFASLASVVLSISACGNFTQQKESNNLSFTGEKSFLIIQKCESSYINDKRIGLDGKPVHGSIKLSIQTDAAKSKVVSASFEAFVAGYVLPSGEYQHSAVYSAKSLKVTDFRTGGRHTFNRRFLLEPKQNVILNTENSNQSISLDSLNISTDASDTAFLSLENLDANGQVSSSIELGNCGYSFLQNLKLLDSIK